jgi:hypothetical protein
MGADFHNTNLVTFRPVRCGIFTWSWLVPRPEVILQLLDGGFVVLLRAVHWMIGPRSGTVGWWKDIATCRGLCGVDSGLNVKSGGEDVTERKGTKDESQR